MDEKEWNLYISRQRAIWDFNTGISEAKRQGLENGLRQGIEEGVKLEKLEIAKIMLKKEIDIQTIEEITGLTKDEIEKLK